MTFYSTLIQLGLRYFGSHIGSVDQTVMIKSKKSSIPAKLEKWILTEGNFISHYQLKPSANIEVIALSEWGDKHALAMRPTPDLIQLPVPYATERDYPVEFLLHYHVRRCSENVQRHRLYAVAFSLSALILPRLLGGNLIINLALSLFLSQSILKWTGLLDKVIDLIQYIVEERSPLDVALTKVTDEGLRSMLVYLYGKMQLDRQTGFDDATTFLEIEHPKTTFAILYSRVRAEYLRRGLKDSIEEVDKLDPASPLKSATRRA